jgi:Sulfotransferase domain
MSGRQCGGGHGPPPVKDRPSVLAVPVHVQWPRRVIRSIGTGPAVAPVAAARHPFAGAQHARHGRMKILLWALAIIGVLIVFFIAQLIHLSVVLTWSDQKTRGLGYYGLPPDEREKFKKTLRLHARLLYPILRLIGGRSSFSFRTGSFTHRGVAGPRGTCSAESFAKVDEYAAKPEDIFVVTQMKCGTTWMQHVVYEVLLRGRGDIVQSGRTLYALSPWIESLKSVPIEDAPLIGEDRPSRVIKTHLPAQLCPWSEDAKYIYVARHPVSCFASCIDFVATNIGASSPALPQIEEWFCSPELMWWGTWTDHVKGWWERSRRESNVLFVHFEAMKKDLPGVVHRVADFLGIRNLGHEEIAAIVEKTGFRYMQQHKDAFEMNPPHLLQTDAELFVRGSADRHKDVPADAKQRIAEWCRREMEESDYPLAAMYPDVEAMAEG